MAWSSQRAPPVLLEMLLATTQSLALATAPPERGERNASTRRSRHHLWDWSSLSAAHRGCVVHALESRRLGGAAVVRSRAQQRSRAPPPRRAAAPRVLYGVGQQRACGAADGQGARRRSTLNSQCFVDDASHRRELMETHASPSIAQGSTRSSTRASLCAVALLQACGARARVSGAHVRANDIVHEDASAAPAVCGSCVRATVQSSAQERSEPLVLSVASAPHTAPARALRSIAAGASIAGALCVERLLPAFGRRTPAASRDDHRSRRDSPRPRRPVK